MSCTPTEFLRVATNTAEYFGFQTVDQLLKTPECKNCRTSQPHKVTTANKRTDELSGLLSKGVITFCEQKLHALEKPVLLYSIEQVPYTNEAAVSFHIFNVERSIAEAILIQASLSSCRAQ